MPRTRLILYAAIAAVIGVVYFSGTLATLFIEWQWFDAVGYRQVFTTLLGARLVPGLVVGGLAFGVIYGSGAVAMARIPPAPTPKISLIDPHHAPGSDGVPPELVRRGLLGVAGVLAVLHGLWGTTRWEDALLFLHRQPFGYTEPILGHDASFYVFTLPLLDDLRGLAFALVILSGLVAAAAYAMRGAIRLEVREVDGRVVPQGVQVDPRATAHLGVHLGVLLAVVAVGVFLARFDVLYDHVGVISGPTYSDVHGHIPLLTAQAVATAVAGGLVAFGVARRRTNLVITGLGAAGAAWIGARVYPEMLQRFSVLPNELNREAPYIAHHVEATRFAFALDAIEERNLTGDAALTRADIDANRGTTRNVRLWDHGVLLDTFSQVQEIRTYYDFAFVDNDRYVIDGELRQIMLSPRELQPSSLPAQARTWVNETMTYTHGYGMALGPVNEVTPQGLPELFIKDLPPVIEFPDDLAVTRPELYFGETMRTEVFVGTRNEEFDYPSGEQNRYTVYDGKGGVSLGSLLSRVALAVRLQNAMVLLTSDLTDDSRVLLHRQIRERAQVIAPFLSFDPDPYLAIVDGRLLWILDAYTTSSRFPYAAPAGVRGIGNYMRNSVKVTIDAYDGDVIFYAMDDADPVLAAWRGTLPGVFRDAAEMPPGVRAHLRYPADYFRVQTELFATFHMTNPQIFYNREDAWEVPSVHGARMEPYYTIMRLPGEEREEFIQMLPFVPRNKPNLAAWMVARSDDPSYGVLRAYRFPKDKMVYGPEMIVARINQDDTISEKLSLWNQQGSTVVLGTLLVIPIEESLIYVQPLYLQATSGSIPELKRVIVGYEDTIAMEPTLDLALDRLFGAKGARVAEAVVAEVSAAADAPAVDVRAPDGVNLPASAREHYDALRAAAGAGDWTAFGEHLDALGAVLQDMGPAGEPAQDEADQK